MSCLLITEINSFLLNEHSVANLNTEIKALNITAITPSYATGVSISIINQLRQLTDRPLLVSQEWNAGARECDLILTNESLPFPLHHPIHFLKKENASCWTRHNAEALAKDDCARLLEWLTRGEEGDNVAMIIPYAILPVVAALKSIHSLDPYLATHYLQQLKPLLPMLSIPLQQEICRLKLIRSEELNLMAESVSPSAERYIRLERKLHRKYRDH